MRLFGGRHLRIRAILLYLCDIIRPPCVYGTSYARLQTMAVCWMGVSTVNVRQLSVFIENKSGRVSEVTEVLGRVGVNIRGFSVSDTADYGIVRLVVNDPDAALTALHEAGFTVKESEVLCLNLPDRPGGLAGVLKTVSAAGVNIEYVYSLVSTYVVINVADMDRAIALLQNSPVELVTQEEIAGL